MKEHDIPLERVIEEPISDLNEQLSNMPSEVSADKKGTDDLWQSDEREKTRKN
jgi:hypothetical protein